MASSRSRSNSGVKNGFESSISSSGRCYGSSFTNSSSVNSSFSSGFASSSSSFTSRSSSFFQRSASPTRVNLYGSVQGSPSVRFSMADRPISPSRSITASTRDQVVKTTSNRLNVPSSTKRTCMCSPTTHPGSFRCNLHKNSHNHSSSVSFPSNRLNARRSAMTNSLVRIGTVEGDLVKRALAALIRPSSHQQRRRASFQPRQSRLSIMSKAIDDI
ncbi:hypothetical protein MKX01_025976 [Papaver californicum]|nr:hypothetical protein MKX01_025976 [Papaver californicum]